MFIIPDKIANFTDEIAKSRIKIFQLCRKLLAFTFRFIKTNSLYIFVKKTKNIDLCYGTMVIIHQVKR